MSNFGSSVPDADLYESFLNDPKTEDRLAEQREQEMTTVSSFQDVSFDDPDAVSELVVAEEFDVSGLEPCIPPSDGKITRRSLLHIFSV